MDEVWDAVVVGAGPAGCAAAYDLQARGRRVLLVDRARFPRPKACAGGLTMKAVRALRYPIDPVVRRWCRDLNLERSAVEDVNLRRRDPVCAMTVRAELDMFCLAKTLELGTRFERVGTLRSLSRSEQGVSLRFDGERCFSARFVIGADGVHSAVRKMTAAGEWFRTAFAVEADVEYDPERENLPPCTFDFAPVARGYGWLFPRHDHVNVGLYVEGGQKVGRAALDGYIEQRCGGGRRRSDVVGQFLGLGAAGYAPGEGTRVLLAGDAAGFVDPLTGEGISGAIRSGQAAAAAVHAALGSEDLARSYRRAIQAVQADLRIAEHAAERFHADPARGWRLLEMPFLPALALRAYGDGLPLRRLLQAARFIGRLQSF